VRFDVPVVDLDRAAAFYAAVIGIGVHKEQFDGASLCVLEHQDSNGGCLIENKSAVAPDKGISVYMNVDRRIRDAVAEATKHGGQMVQDIHAIDPHGFRGIVLDSEVDRIALHSTIDA